MASTFQTSSPTTAQTDYLVYGNSNLPNVSQVSTSGSKNYDSEVSIAGLHSNVANNAVVTIEFPDTTGANFYIDIVIRCFSNTTVAQSNFTVMKPTVSTTWFQFYGQQSAPNGSLLIAPSISINSGTGQIIVQQSAASTDDGVVNYMIKFSYASGNSPNLALPIFK